MAGNKYGKWTQEDARRLLELHAVGRSPVSISAALRRSRGAVVSRITLLRALAKSPQTAGSNVQDHAKRETAAAREQSTPEPPASPEELFLVRFRRKAPAPIGG